MLYNSALISAPHLYNRGANDQAKTYNSMQKIATAVPQKNAEPTITDVQIPKQPEH
jgi:hypothetical protein